MNIFLSLTDLTLDNSFREDHWRKYLEKKIFFSRPYEKKPAINKWIHRRQNNNSDWNISSQYEYTKTIVKEKPDRDSGGDHVFDARSQVQLLLWPRFRSLFHFLLQQQVMGFVSFFWTIDSFIFHEWFMVCLTCHHRIVLFNRVPQNIRNSLLELMNTNHSVWQVFLEDLFGHREKATNHIENPIIKRLFRGQTL